jgi:two-component system sensor histidine kinase QseC
MMRSANSPRAPLWETGANFKSGFANVQIAGSQWRVFATYGAENDVQVYVGEEMESRTSILSAVLRSTLYPMAVALPLLALVLWWAVRRSLQPLHQLGSTLAQRRPDALQALEMDDVPSEMAPMVRALNGLFERIGVLLESERRFTADASHELRTPIAAIRAQAQVALGAAEDASRRTALHNTLLGCDRAIHLVEQLLTLSRLDASAAPPMARLDLAALARQVVAEAAAPAISKSQVLEFDGPAPCAMQGNEALLSILIRNLVDNAVRYSPSGATIQVSVREAQGQVTLAVQDSGPGMSDTDRARLGERFFRVTGNAEPGSGLGWSIVQRIAAVHRLTLLVQRCALLGGLSVSIKALSI